MKNSNPSKGAVREKRGIVAVHCFNNTPLTSEEHEQLVAGPIAAASDAVEEARRRVDSELVGTQIIGP